MSSGGGEITGKFGKQPALAQRESIDLSPKFKHKTKLVTSASATFHGGLH